MKSMPSFNKKIAVIVVIGENCFLSLSIPFSQSMSHSSAFKPAAVVEETLDVPAAAVRDAPEQLIHIARLFHMLLPLLLQLVFFLSKIRYCASRLTEIVLLNGATTICSRRLMLKDMWDSKDSTFLWRFVPERHRRSLLQ